MKPQIKKSIVTIGWEDFVLDTDDAMKVMAALALVMQGEHLKNEYVKGEDDKTVQVSTLHPVSDFRPTLRHMSPEQYAVAKAGSDLTHNK